MAHGDFLQTMKCARAAKRKQEGPRLAHPQDLLPHLGTWKGLDGPGLDGASDPPKLERQADVRAVPGDRPVIAVGRDCFVEGTRPR